MPMGAQGLMGGSVITCWEATLGHTLTLLTPVCTTEMWGRFWPGRGSGTAGKDATSSGEGGRGPPDLVLVQESVLVLPNICFVHPWKENPGTSLMC